ncbi:MAG: hypothetical protein RIS25_674 [Actinomycetota bacterium]|jgi:ribosomal-protein-alanine N-acetyltransferase
MLDVSVEHNGVRVRTVRRRDAVHLDRELHDNRAWLVKWEATLPGNSTPPPIRDTLRTLRAMARRNLVVPCVIEFEGQVVGQITVSGLSYGSLASGTVGYWVSESVAGKGITPIAVALLTDWCFAHLGLHRMEIALRPENNASYRVVQKLGFRYEGLRRNFIHIDGDWRDHVAFAVTADEVGFSGVLNRFLRGRANERLAEIPELDRVALRTPVTRG